VNLALFDLDNTLLNGDSDFEWSQFLIRIGVLDRELFEARNLAFYEHYKAGTLDIHEFLDFQLKPLARHARKTLDEWHGQFMREQVSGMITQAARALVNRHLAAGDVCVIITATNSFVTAPIAREFGIEHLIATEPDTGTANSPDGSPMCRVSAREKSPARKTGWRSAAGTGAALPTRLFTAIRLMICRCWSR
jgi:HAD superfamily phosphoserine phosphatase-like hydrolase